MRKTGFTLVELSIVLVIIGLLIGGILVGQSMISTAKTQAFVRQIQQIDAAVENFKTKYNGLPGDSVAMGCVAVNNKCGDGIISDDQIYPDPTQINYFDAEIGSFWPQLQMSGYNAAGPAYLPQTHNQGNGADYPIGNAPPQNNIPQTAMGSKNGGIIAYGNFASQSNYYQVSGFNGNPNTDWGDDGVPADAFTPAEALAYDKKVDDGNPTTGSVRGYTGINESVGYYDPGPGSGYCYITGNQYNLASTNYICTLRIDMLAQSGGQ